MTRDHIGQSMRPAPTVPSYSEDGKAVDVGKGARGWGLITAMCLMKIGSTGCLGEAEGRQCTRLR